MWEVCEALQLYIVFNCIVIQYVHAMYSLYLCPFATSIDMAITYDYSSKSNGVWAGLHVVCTYSTVCKYVGTYVCKLLLVSTCSVPVVGCLHCSPPQEERDHSDDQCR